MFVAIPYHVRAARQTAVRPVSNSIIIILTVVAFLLQTSGWFLSPGAAWWTALTYGFAHANHWHLLGNMFVLLMIGNPVNRRVGNGWYAAAYLGTIVLMGTLGRMLDVGPLMGSSGAIYAVVAMFLLLMPAAIVSMSYAAVFPSTLLVAWAIRPTGAVDWFIRWGTFRMRAWSCIVLVPVVEVWSLLWWRYQYGVWQWMHPAHLFGLACGVAVVLLLPLRISMGRGMRFDLADLG